MPRNLPAWATGSACRNGTMILGLYGALLPPWRYVTLLGLIPLGTASVGDRPLYGLMGWNRAR